MVLQLYKSMNTNLDFELPAINFLDPYLNLAESPMPPEGTDLSTVTLSRSQRLWLAIAVSRRHFKPRELANKWNIKYRYIWKLSNKLKNGIIPTAKSGRPRVIDVDGMATLRAAVRSHGVNAKSVLKQTADIAYTDTFKRRHSEVEDVGEVHLSMKRRSRFRYVAAASVEVN